MSAIKPNTKVKILSKEHSRYVQDLAIANGFKWCNGASYMDLDSADGSISFWDDMDMTCGVGNINGLKEIFIDLPEPSIESKILSEKVNGIKGERGPDLTLDHQGVYKLFNRPEADAIRNAMGVNKESKATASAILSAAKNHLDERARIYDKPEGERSIASVVEAFNSLTGDGLMNTDERGWMFMTLLKLSRSQQGSFKLDNYEDGASYFSLMGEAASKNSNQNK